MGKNLESLVLNYQIHFLHVGLCRNVSLLVTVLLTKFNIHDCDKHLFVVMKKTSIISIIGLYKK